MNKDEYEFHEDWDISSFPHLSATRVSKSDVMAYYREVVEEMIPAEYREKIEYRCRRRKPYHRRFHMPFVLWWLYPGKKLKAKA